MGYFSCYPYSFDSAGMKRKRPMEAHVVPTCLSGPRSTATQTPLIMPPRRRRNRPSPSRPLFAMPIMLIIAALLCAASGENVVVGGGGGIRGQNRHDASPTLTKWQHPNHGGAVTSSVIDADMPYNRQLQRGHGKAKDDGYGYGGGGKEKDDNAKAKGGDGGGGGWGFGFGGGGGGNKNEETGDEESGTGFGDDDSPSSGYGYGSGSTTTSGGYGDGGGSSSSSSTHSGYGSGSSSYGSSTSGGYGSSSGGSSYGSSSYGSSSAGSSSYGSSYSSSGGGYSHSSSYDPSGSGGFSSAMKVQIPLLPVILLSVIFFPAVTLYTAYAFEHNAEGTYANFCRLQLNCMTTVYSFLYNLWHCRLGEVADVVCAMDDEDEYGKKFTDEELEKMNPRKGLDRALEIEHKRAVRKARKAGREGNSNGADVEMNRLT